MSIDGNFYQNDIKQVLKTGALNATEIKQKLADRQIKLDEIQILIAIESLIRQGTVVRSFNRFALRTEF